MLFSFSPKSKTKQSALTLITAVAFHFNASAGLIGFYPFDDSSNALNDRSGNSNLLTIPATAPTFVAAGGLEGGAYVFNGTQRLTAPIDINPGTRPQVTIGAWVKTNTTSGRAKVIGSDNGGWDRSIGLDDRAPVAGSFFRYTAFTGNTAPLYDVANLSSTTPPSATTWTFIAATYDQTTGTVVMYLDKDVSTKTDGLYSYSELGHTADAGFATLSIGSLRPDSQTESWNGTIDNVFVYDEVLSAAQLTQIRNLGRAHFIAPPGIPTTFDANANGLDDIWEMRYRVPAGTNPTADTDGDGQTNLKEAIAGTDPFSNKSTHTVALETVSATNVTFRCQTQRGKKYRLMRSANLTVSSFVAEGVSQVATGPETMMTIPRSSAQRQFYRVEVSDEDTDGDGVSNWSELQLGGINPTQADTYSGDAAPSDRTVALAMVQELNSGSVKAMLVNSDAAEAGGSPAQILIQRTAPSIYPLSINFDLSGAITPQKSSAGASEYNLTYSTTTGVQTQRQLTMLAGSTTATVSINAVPDALVEVPEEIRFRLRFNGAASLLVRVVDRTNNSTNDKLFVSYLQRDAGISSNGTGVATALLSGSNNIARLSVSFKNLTRAQTNASLKLGSNNIAGMPLGQVKSFDLPIAAFGTYATDQAMLDAILSGQLNLKIGTSQFNNGEIAGAFIAAAGSTSAQALPPTPALEVVTNFNLDRDIARFLTQATFGVRWQDIVAMRARVAAAGGNRMIAYEQWIDEQLAMQSPSLQAWVNAADQIHRIEGDRPFQFNALRGFYTQASHAKAQLRGKFAHALSQILVISGQDRVIGDRATALANWNDMLQERAFGRYEDLLLEVSLKPQMGIYLSSFRNRAQFTENGITVFPDENYAREIMQLFSIGLFQLHPDGTLILDKSGQPIPTYDQNDILNISRVFTGLSFSKRPSVITQGSLSYGNPAQAYPSTTDNNDFFLGIAWNDSRYGQQFQNPMKVFPEFHDFGQKNYLGVSYTPPAGNGLADIVNVVDVLSNHPSTAPFICRRLIQRMVTSNPSRGYLGRVSQVYVTHKNASDHLARVVKAILLDPEARNLNLSNNDDFGKRRDPMMLLTSFNRALNWQSRVPIHDPSYPQQGGRMGDPRLNNSTAPTAGSGFNYALSAEQLALYEPGARQVRNSFTEDAIQQEPFYAPSVFNWWLPDYAVGGAINNAGLTSPEFQVLTEATSYLQLNAMAQRGDRGTRGFGDTLPGTLNDDWRGSPEYGIDRDNNNFLTTNIYESITRFTTSGRLTPGLNPNNPGSNPSSPGVDPNTKATDAADSASAEANPSAPKIYMQKSMLFQMVLDTLDSNADGLINDLDPICDPANSIANRNALDRSFTEAWLDRLDLLLCSGQLKAEEIAAGPAVNNSDRDLLLEQLLLIRPDHMTNNPTQNPPRPDRVINAFLLRYRTAIWTMMATDKGQIQR